MDPAGFIGMRRVAPLAKGGGYHCLVYPNIHVVLPGLSATLLVK